MEGKLRVGVIGCGEISSNHVLGYLNSARYEIVALADLSEQAMNDFDKQFSEHEDYKPEHFTDAREMLEKSELDVVSVGVWDMGHAPMTIAAAASGVLTVMRTSSEPASASAFTCAAVLSTSAVSVLVMD